MKLSDAVTKYIAHKRALGMDFRADGFLLRAFSKALGAVTVAQVGTKSVVVFLNGAHPGQVSSYWTKKFSVLAGFYRFALARGYAKTSPLPSNHPRLTAPVFVPYIYSQQELKWLIEAIPAVCNARTAVEADAYRALLLLLYGAGLRLGEAIALRTVDVDLEHAILCIRDSKFHKTRWVPLGQDLTRALIQFAGKRRNGSRTASQAAFLCMRNGDPLSRSVAQRTFRRLRAQAGVLRQTQGRYEPRLHDLRHTAAVHRLIAWYRDGANLQQLLPKLATYLGHTNLSATQRYLTLTPEVLQAASARFERYAREGAL